MFEEGSDTEFIITVNEIAILDQVLLAGDQDAILRIQIEVAKHLDSLVLVCSSLFHYPSLRSPVYLVAILLMKPLALYTVFAERVVGYILPRPLG